MTNFDPEFQVVSLDQAPLASLVIFDGAPAFVGINPSPGAQVKVLAQYQSTSGQFVYRYSDSVPRVLLPDQEFVVIRPNLEAFTIDANLAPQSSQLFIDQAERFVVVAIPGANLFRLLSLNSGHLNTSSTSQKDAFTAWEAGVISLGQFIPLLTI
jgi:hypothetical protein